MASLITTIVVDCQNVTGELNHIWTSIGFDEINFSYTERGKDLLQTLKDEAMEKPYYVRNHNAFTSGNGFPSYPVGGSTNIYIEDNNGNPIYNFEIIDKIYDSYVANNFIPIIELGFMPFDLVSNKNQFKSDEQTGGIVVQEDYELNAWKNPPKDYEKWKNLVVTFVSHLYQRYGTQVENWYFEVWNEPDITNYWLGTFEEYCKLYDYSADAIKSVNQNLKIGGPATTNSGGDFLNQFLQHVTTGINYVTQQIGAPIDFISFHSKAKDPIAPYKDFISELFIGAFYNPLRSYGHKVPFQTPSVAKMVNDISSNLGICSKYSKLNAIPVIVDECDPTVGYMYGVYDNPNFIVCNTEYYPSMIAAMIYNILLISSRIHLITSWDFYMEGKRLFEGNRTLVTNYNLPLPVLNGFKLFGKLKYQQFLIEINDNSIPINGICTFDETNLNIQFLLFSHVDDWTLNDNENMLIIFNNVKLKSVLVKHYRIDSNNNNVYSEWIRMGKPDYFSPEQLIDLQNYRHLQLFNPPIEYKIENNQLILGPYNFSTHSVDFFEIINQSNNI